MLTGFASGDLAEVIEKVTGADALILVTPLFTTTYSGLFKSFVDILDKDSCRACPCCSARRAAPRATRSRSSTRCARCSRTCTRTSRRRRSSRPRTTGPPRATARTTPPAPGPRPQGGQGARGHGRGQDPRTATGMFDAVPSFAQMLGK
ncbi:NAD(P)H-dependent oxidoreductase [Oerskovia sp. M15]